jgi:hypothetical protein
MIDDKQDKKLIIDFIQKCIYLGFNLKQMGDSVGKTESWASNLIHAKNHGLRFQTRNAMRKFLKENK